MLRKTISTLRVDVNGRDYWFSGKGEVEMLASKLQAESPSTAAVRMRRRRVVITLLFCREFCG